MSVEKLIISEDLNQISYGTTITRFINVHDFENPTKCSKCHFNEPELNYCHLIPCSEGSRHEKYEQGYYELDLYKILEKSE
jgi:hypothetical protein